MKMLDGRDCEPKVALALAPSSNNAIQNKGCYSPDQIVWIECNFTQCTDGPFTSLRTNNFQ